MRANSLIGVSDENNIEGFIISVVNLENLATGLRLLRLVSLQIIHLPFIQRILTVHAYQLYGWISVESHLLKRDSDK
jgi:hypothetical protein